MTGAARPVLALVVVTLLATGCGDDAPPPVDAAMDGGDADAGATVMPEAPAIPAPTTMAPCADGWTEREVVEGATVCEPASPLPDCTGIGRAVIGEAACRDVGRACGDDEWPDVSDVTRSVHYVREGESGGDGSESAPFGTIQEAVTAATGGDVIAIARGSYGGPFINVFRNVELRGVCTAGVELTTRFVARRAQVKLESVTIRGADQAVLVDEVATLTLEGVAILDSATLAVNVTAGAHLFATDVVVRGVEPMPSGGLFGWGLNVDFASDATLRECEIDGARGVGATSLLDDTEVVFEDSVIRNVAQDADGTGRALTVGSGARLRATRVVIDEGTEFAAVADGVDSELVLEDTVVGNTQPRDDGELGGGAAVQNAGRLELRRVFLSDNHRAAIQIAGASTAIVEDVVVADTLPEPASGIYGRALLVGAGSDATVRRFVALRSHHSGILAAGGGTVLRLEDARVHEVAEVQPDDVPFATGRGLTVGLGARAEVARVTIREAGDVGILTDDADLVATDVIVRDSRGETTRGLLGHGMQTLRSRVSLTRARFENNRGAGILVGIAPGEATLSEISIVDTRERACADSTCPGLGAGIGLTVLEGGYADISRFAITGGTLCGLQLASGGTADARDGLVAGHPIGANVQTEGFDVGRITESVRYDNDLNLDSSSLPVPTITEE